jgi:type I restriction enzyme S subunit
MNRDGVWSTVPIGEVVTFRAGVGFPIPMQGRTTGELPFAKVGDISRHGRAGLKCISTADMYVDNADLEKLRAQPVPPGSTLFAKIGEAIRHNHRVLSATPMLIDNNAMAASPSERVDSDYLYRFLQSIDMYRLTSATTVPALRKSELERIPIPLPPLDEQRRIAAILDRADALKIEHLVAAEKFTELLDSIRTQALTDGSWELARLGDVADFVNGVAFKPEDWHETGLPIIRIQNLTDPKKPINLTNRKVADKYKVRRGDILVSWSATLGVFTWERTDVALVNQHIFRVIPNSAKADSGFLKQVLQGALVDMERHLHGATMKHVNRGEFLATTIPLPPLHVQRQIAAILDHVDGLRSMHLEAARHSRKLLSCLSAQAFAGQL